MAVPGGGCIAKKQPASAAVLYICTHKVHAAAERALVQPPLLSRTVRGRSGTALHLGLVHTALGQKLQPIVVGHLFKQTLHRASPLLYECAELGLCSAGIWIAQSVGCQGSGALAQLHISAWTWSVE